MVLRRPVASRQYLAIRYTERLAEAGIEPSVGGRGDTYDNALAETVIGPFKTEVIHQDEPWRGVDDVEFATIERVSWFNTARLLEPLGYLPPAECEEQFHQSQLAQLGAGDSTNRVSGNPGAIQTPSRRPTCMDRTRVHQARLRGNSR